MKQVGTIGMLMIGIQFVPSSELSWTPAIMKSFVVSSKKKSQYSSL